VRDGHPHDHAPGGVCRIDRLERLLRVATVERQRHQVGGDPDPGQHGRTVAHLLRVVGHRRPRVEPLGTGELTLVPDGDRTGLDPIHAERDDPLADVAPGDEVPAAPGQDQAVGVDPTRGAVVADGEGATARDRVDQVGQQHVDRQVRDRGGRWADGAELGARQLGPGDLQEVHRRGQRERHNSPGSGRSGAVVPSASMR
jgi:hypothetical protein